MGRGCSFTWLCKKWQYRRGKGAPIYYVSKAILDVETHYSNAKKICLALIMAAQKLHPYFQYHFIKVLTKLPLRQILQSLEASGRLSKWLIELREFNIQ